MTKRIDVQIPAPDGTAKATLHIPDGDGPHPGVLVFPDAGGYRETMKADFGDRLASLGYVALSPDVFYREGDWAPIDLKTAFSDEKERARLFGYMGNLTNERVIADSQAYVDFLLNRPEVSGSAVGTTGYCMGGRLSLIAAGALGDKIAAAASFHGGNIGKDEDPNSPHHAADKIKAAVYVGGAIEDQSYPPEQAEALEKALTEAGVKHKLETYQAKHGWCVPDHTTYDKAAAEKHWQVLESFFGENLKQ